MVDAHDKPIAGAPIAAYEWRGHHSLKWSTETDAEGRFHWDEAPAERVLIDVGSLGFHPGRRRWWLAPAPEEKTITMRRPLHIRGGVIDSETGKSIKPFTLIPGSAWDNTRPPSWEYDQAHQATGSSYEITLGTEAPLRFLRVEAEGYLPGVSRGFKDDEDTLACMFKLRRGTWTEGMARGPDGLPLAGADVILVLPSEHTFIRNGQPPDRNDHRVLKTGADGRFRFPPQEPPYTILLLHDLGFAEQTIGPNTRSSQDLKVQPWGRIEGTLRIGKRAGTGELISLDYDRPDDWASKALPSWAGEARTDNTGRFDFERVLPGKAHVARVIRVQLTANVWDDNRTVGSSIELAPGVITRVSLGGTGRPIIGKLTAPVEIADRVDWVQTTNCLIPKAPADARHDAAIAGPPARPSHTAVLAKDGSFRIDDVGAGRYDVLFVVNEPTSGPDAPPTHKPIASVRRELVVPEMPGGRSDLPLDLGTISLQPIKQ